MSADLRSQEISKPGPARASLEALRRRWGVAETWKSPPEMVLVNAPSGRELWVRVSPDVYELRSDR